MSDKLGIGSSVWTFDINSRVYEKDEKGKSIGPPTHRGHFRERKIVGETSRSWILDSGMKVSKKDPTSLVFTSLQAVEEDVFIHENKQKIVNLIQYGKLSYDKLVRIKEIIDE